jgi:hypothetical protein
MQLGVQTSSHWNVLLQFGQHLVDITLLTHAWQMEWPQGMMRGHRSFSLKFSRHTAHDGTDMTDFAF